MRVWFASLGFYSIRRRVKRTRHQKEKNRRFFLQSFILSVWFRGRDLNPYVVDTRPSNVRVCQFRHPDTVMVCSESVNQCNIIRGKMQGRFYRVVNRSICLRTGISLTIFNSNNLIFFIDDKNSRLKISCLAFSYLNI